LTNPIQVSKNIFNLAYISRSRLHRNRANLIQTLHTVSALEQAGIHVTLFLPPWKRKCNLQERLRELGIQRNLDIRASRSLHSRWKIWPFILFHKSTLSQADAVFTRSPEVSIILSRANLPHYLEIHEVKQLANKNLLHPIIEAYNGGIIKWLLPISQSAARGLVEAGAAKDRILVNPCGVDIRAFQGVPPLDPKRLTFPRILHAGRIGPKRGSDILKEIAKKKLAQLLLVGEVEKDFLSHPFVKVSPHVPHAKIPQLYASCEIVLLPYQRTTPTSDSMSPLKLFEAMAAGRPIIASDLPPLREILEHEKTALLVEPENIEAWIRAIETLKNDPALALRLSNTLRQEAHRYSWEARAQRIASLLKSDTNLI